MDAQAVSSRVRHPDTEGSIEVHYWASARAAAGVGSELVAVERPISLAELVTRLAALHPEGELAKVLHVCSVLHGETQVGNRDPETVVVGPGDVVEFLPPFAGG